MTSLPSSLYWQKIQNLFECFTLKLIYMWLGRNCDPQFPSNFWFRDPYLALYYSYYNGKECFLNQNFFKYERIIQIWNVTTTTLTRMHSSRMCTARSLVISRSISYISGGPLDADPPSPGCKFPWMQTPIPSACWETNPPLPSARWEAKPLPPPWTDRQV